MKKRSTLAAGCGLFVSLVFAGAAQAQSAQDFVNKVAISDMFEIQSSQLALSKQPDNDTKPFAQRMVTDHQKTSKELKSLVDGGKVKATLPSALDAEHQKMLDDLKAKNGKDFDQSYDQIQVKRTKMRSRCLRLTPREATIQNLRDGRRKPCLISNGTSRWRRS